MMNYIWAGIIIVSIVVGAVSGHISEVASALLDGGNQAVQLLFGLLGTMCLFNGLMKIAEESGITLIISRLLRPVVNIIMPGLKKEGKAIKAVCMNITANLLGLGNAATPLGLAAMKYMAEEEHTGHNASSNMITFVVLNTASIQIIPTTAAMIRANYGAKSPMDIVPCVWICSVAALAVGLTLCKLLEYLTFKKTKQRRGI